ncbi:hypothetical protein AVEN_119229-1 [Araneus ventricosus]|uniref:Uncharacterized protein n=1 Tax=Araneus ventricosus TaxID=182803 RepID=A0A4Y2IL89_ARAVE|nr:hypothetical protein AVEN_119229-1 [Araneus ventricosus]
METGTSASPKPRIHAQMCELWGSPHCSYRCCPNFPKNKVTEGKTFVSAFKEREKTVNSNAKTPNQNVQLTVTPKNTDTSLLTSQETVIVSLPQDLLANKELADLFRFRNKCKLF